MHKEQKLRGVEVEVFAQKKKMHFLFERGVKGIVMRVRFSTGRGAYRDQD